MRLVWSQTSSSQERSRGPIPVAVACIFLGSLLTGRPGETPRPFRAAAASLFTTGGVLFLVGAARFALQKTRRSAPSLTLAPSPKSSESQSVSGLQEEEQL
jgi:hypothetical protein